MTGRISVEEMRRRVDEGRDPHTGEKVRGLGPGLRPLVKPALAEKRCKVCGKTKPIAEFYRQFAMRDGHRNECKACQNAAWKRRYYKRKEKP